MGTNLQGWWHTELWQHSLSNAHPHLAIVRKVSLGRAAKRRDEGPAAVESWYLFKNPTNFGLLVHLQTTICRSDILRYVCVCVASNQSKPINYHAVLPAEKQSCITAKVWTQTLRSTLPITEPSWSSMLYLLMYLLMKYAYTLLCIMCHYLLVSWNM